MRKAPHPPGCARCGASAGCSAIKHQSIYASTAASYPSVRHRDTPPPVYPPRGTLASGESSPSFCEIAVLDAGPQPSTPNPNPRQEEGRALAQLQVTSSYVSSLYTQVYSVIHDSGAVPPRAIFCLVRSHQGVYYSVQSLEGPCA